MICKYCKEEIIFEFNFEDVDIEELDAIAKCDCCEIKTTCLDLDDLKIFIKNYVMNRVIDD